MIEPPTTCAACGQHRAVMIAMDAQGWQLCSHCWPTGPNPQGVVPPDPRFATATKDLLASLTAAAKKRTHP